MTAHARSTVDAINTELRSPFVSGVSNRAWTRFVHALSISDERGPTHGQPRLFSSASYAGLGCFAMRPRRLVEIGVLKSVVTIKGKTVPSPEDKQRLLAFLQNPIEQYRRMVVSLRRYDAALPSSLPEGMTRSGALALHHRLGPKALEKWAKHQEPSTTALFQRTNGLF